MKLEELYKGYDGTEEYLDERVNMQSISVDGKITIAKGLIETCTKTDENDFEYIDRSLLDIALKVAIVSGLTDIDFGGTDVEGDENTSGYDMIVKLDLYRYVTDRNSAEVFEFESFIHNEERTFDSKHSLEAVVNKRMKAIEDVMSAVGTSLKSALDVFENVDEEKISSIKNLLANMNTTIEEMKDAEIAQKN